MLATFFFISMVLSMPLAQTVANMVIYVGTILAISKLDYTV